MEETTLLYHCRALCMDEADTLLDNAFVVVQGATIRSVGTERPAGEFTHEIDCRGNVLMPGLVNAHTHIPMTLLRGYGGGCDLQTWLNDWIFPAEAKLDDRAVKAGAGLALAELIASGVTTIADMYMHTPAIAETVLQAGISANLSCGGVRVTDNLEVLGWDLKPVKGFYAAGETVAGVHGAFYCGGNACGFAHTSGFMAGKFVMGKKA